MNTHNITYDLRTPGKDYADLINALGRFPKAVRYQQSSWLVRTPLSVIDVLTQLNRFIDANDLLMVSASHDAAWSAAQNTTCGNAILWAYT